MPRVIFAPLNPGVSWANDIRRVFGVAVVIDLIGYYNRMRAGRDVSAHTIAGVTAATWMIANNYAADWGHRVPMELAEQAAFIYAASRIANLFYERFLGDSMPTRGGGLAMDLI